jgi:hypothetical protein
MVADLPTVGRDATDLLNLNHPPTLGGFSTDGRCVATDPDGTEVECSVYRFELPIQLPILGSLPARFVADMVSSVDLPPKWVGSYPSW